MRVIPPHPSPWFQWLNVVRTPELAVVRVVMATVVALVLGSLFWMSNNNTEGLRERASYFAYGVCVCLCVCVCVNLEAEEKAHSVDVL